MRGSSLGSPYNSFHTATNDKVWSPGLEKLTAKIREQLLFFICGWEAALLTVMCYRSSDVCCHLLLHSDEALTNYD